MLGKPERQCNDDRMMPADPDEHDNGGGDGFIARLTVTSPSSPIQAEDNGLWRPPRRSAG